MASLPTRVFSAVSSPSFSATRTSHKKVDASTGSPPAPWGTSPVGSPLGQAEGTPLRYGGLGADPAAAPVLYLPGGFLSGPTTLEGRLGKANRHDLRSPATDEDSHFFERDISAYGYFQGKPSMVASAVPGSFLLLNHTTGILIDSLGAKKRANALNTGGADRGAPAFEAKWDPPPGPG